MNIAVPVKVGDLVTYKRSGTQCFKGINVLLLVLYGWVSFIYIALAVLLIGYKDTVATHQPNQDPVSSGVGQDAQGLDQLGNFGYGMAICSNIACALLVICWIAMCVWRRPSFIGYYKDHPKTNLVVEWTFIATNVCFIVSDRTFVNMIPNNIPVLTFDQAVYPLAMTVVCIFGIMLIYLLFKVCAAFCGKTDAE